MNQYVLFNLSFLKGLMYTTPSNKLISILDFHRPGTSFHSLLYANNNSIFSVCVISLQFLLNFTTKYDSGILGSENKNKFIVCKL